MKSDAEIRDDVINELHWRCLAAIMVAVGALPARERVVQPGPALG